MKWFDTYVSNTLGGSGNQTAFSAEGDFRTGRVYYKLFAPGKLSYSLLFSNIIDSTYKPEFGTVCNTVCDEWEIGEVSVGLCRGVTCENAAEPETMLPLTFGGSREKHVMPGEFFVTDPVELDVSEGDFLCCQLTFRGKRLPYHLESVLPIFTRSDGNWVPDKKMPLPSMVGCARSVTARIGFLGDSITQGIGTPHNGYTHWCALLGEKIGRAYSFWNLGIGYGRGQDAATDGAWLFKAKQMDAVVVAYGSNDIGRGRATEQMKQDFTRIVTLLKEAGVKVFLVSVPPFNWQEVQYTRWVEINDFLTRELSKEVDGFFDIAPLLTDPNQPGIALYGKHPDEAGCRIWADAMEAPFRAFLRDVK